MCLKENALHASIVRSFDIKSVEISYICTQHFWNDTSTLQIPPTYVSLMCYLEPFCCALISICQTTMPSSKLNGYLQLLSDQYRHIAVFIILSCYEFSAIGRWTMDNWRNLYVDTKLLWNQPIKIGHCATLIDYSSMLFVNTLYVDHLIVEFCICILKAMTNYQPKLFNC